MSNGRETIKFSDERKMRERMRKKYVRESEKGAILECGGPLRRKAEKLEVIS
jgi:hypothetical protein